MKKDKILWLNRRQNHYGYDDRKEDLWSEGQGDFHDYPSIHVYG